MGVEEPAQVYTAGNWHGWDLDGGCLATDSGQDPNNPVV
jgi:hypothetical protein